MRKVASNCAKNKSKADPLVTDASLPPCGAGKTMNVLVEEMDTENLISWTTPLS